MSIIIEFRIFKLVLVPNFSVNWQFWFFWPDLPKKGFSGLTQKMWTLHILYIILHSQSSLVRNFCSNWQFCFFGPNLPKKVFPVEKRKSKRHHGILHIWISLGIKFQLKLTILSLFDQIYPRKQFPVENRTSSPRLQALTFCVVNVNSTAVFKHFENLKDLVILNILKEKLIMSCLLGSFYLKDL